MTVLLVLVIVAVIAAAGLLAAMYRRDQPLLGAIAVGVLLAGGILGTAYGVLTGT